MNINNLYSLISSRWFIDERYGNSLLPALFSVLNGTAKLDKSKEIIPEAFIASSSNSIVSASDFNNESNKDNFVLILSLKNPIYKYNQECGPSGTKTKMMIMDRYKNDPSCKGVVLDIDSGGGQVSGTPEFYDYIKNYSKPVVSYTDGLMCSAAYYIGSAADHIIANKRADDIGSIGTMVHFIELSGAWEKIGAKVITEYATKSTEKNKNFEELIKGNPKNYIKNVLDPITDTFHADIKAVRPNLDVQVLKGDTYNAAESFELGLIDEIGTLQTAIDKVFELSKANNSKQDSNSNLNNSNITTMSKINVPLIEAAIGEQFSEGENENGILLTDVQAQAIETLLAANAQAIADAQTANQTLQGTIDSNSTSNTALTEAIQAALTEAEVENSENLSNVEGVQALSALVKEYGSADGSKVTKPLDNASGDNDNPNVIGGIDVSEALNC